jgi:hypothetical protein
MVRLDPEEVAVNIEDLLFDLETLRSEQRWLLHSKPLERLRVRIRDLEDRVVKRRKKLKRISIKMAIKQLQLRRLEDKLSMLSDRYAVIWDDLVRLMEMTDEINAGKHFEKKIEAGSMPNGAY